MFFNRERDMKIERLERAVRGLEERMLQVELDSCQYKFNNLDPYGIRTRQWGAKEAIVAICKHLGITIKRQAPDLVVSVVDEKNNGTKKSK